VQQQLILSVLVVVRDQELMALQEQQEEIVSLFL
jgi:hypothetical protein